MAAAAATSTLRIGTLVLGNDYRHPVVLANEAATIDLLSGGRLELGMGAGWMTVDYQKAGIPLDSAATRIARLDESLTIIKGLMADGPFTFAGEHYSVTDLDGEPKPVQRRRDRWQMSYVVVEENFTDAFAPVVAQLSGK